jgi:tetratricopeptide (TPR) repeat protein
MTKAQRNRGLITTGLAALLSLGLAANAVAQEDRETKQTVAMSQQVYEKLTEIQELVEAKSYSQAQTLTSELLQKTNLSPYETAQIWNLTAYSLYLQERYEDAIQAYRRVLQQEGLPEALVQSTLKTTAQLQFTIEDYEGALRSINELMAQLEEPAADVFMLQGQAYFQMGNYDAALGPIRKAVDMDRAQGNTPKENWLLLLRVIYYEKQDFKSMIDVLEDLIQYYPKDAYLLTLAGAHSELGDTLKQLVIVETLYERGILNTASHITNLANLYLLHETPYKAATLLQKEIDAGVVEANERNLRLLSQAWYTAREDEKSIPPLARAAELSSDGELYIRLAQSHINLENWTEAESALRKGLQMGGLSRQDTANIMLGMAYFNQKKFNSARTAFEAARSDNRSRRTAEQWIDYVDSEIRRAELMEQELPANQTPRDLNELLGESQSAAN